MRCAGAGATRGNGEFGCGISSARWLAHGFITGRSFLSYEDSGCSEDLIPWSRSGCCCHLRIRHQPPKDGRWPAGLLERKAVSFGRRSAALARFRQPSLPDCGLAWWRRGGRGAAGHADVDQASDPVSRWRISVLKCLRMPPEVAGISISSGCAGIDIEDRLAGEFLSGYNPGAGADVVEL